MLERGRYGVEWTKRPEDKESPALLRIVALVIVLALISLAWTVTKRVRAHFSERAEASPESPVVAVVPVAPNTSEPAFRPPSVNNGAKRPPKVRNLLMRLEEAEKRHDVEMAITTIEQIRSLPGSPAADLDDALARRLGTLNFRRLFTLKSAQWVTKTTIKSRSSIERIAVEHGSTLASLIKLNGGDKAALRPGREIDVLHHPRFALIVRRRMRIADLQLNGKFFKRYDLSETSATGKSGAFEVALPYADFWKSVNLNFKQADRAEIELLMPKGAAVVVSEM